MAKVKETKISNSSNDNEITKWLRQTTFITVFEDMLSKDNSVFDGMTPLEIEYRVVHEGSLMTALQAKHEKENEDYNPMIINHMPDLLRMARNHKKNGKYDLSILFFSTYFEHKINDILFKILNSKHKTSKTIQKTLRLNFDDKCTWILDLLDVDPMDESYLKTLRGISEIRNSYIHYKWSNKGYPNKKFEEHMNNIGNLIRYLNIYEENIIYGGKRKKILKTLDIERAFVSYIDLIKIPQSDNSMTDDMRSELKELLNMLQKETEIYSTINSNETMDNSIQTKS